ncbi:MAG: hotdog family protein [Aromatoleum sp.]|jgi:predicted hotdog family 3-hydroxylacyl-ACP dehydratase|uniref:hotdog family protein n=1 Tax=Aromatoleum sp. TaxID=2307007 RepID=UPI002893C679|nr:hotdog family protein [Aromatoleum sp.]MDT3669726.1 hotdog family protein [Aromatoleum sp.]
MNGRPETLDRDAIAARIPHQGRMCLLDRALAWDEGAIHCCATSHRDADNPLREPSGLPTTSGIEYAAQAMALHGALLASATGAPCVGFLASVRGVTLHVARLDTIADDLDVRAERVTGDDHSILYTFTVEAAGNPLVSGRAAVVLDADARIDAMSGSQP